LAAGSLLTSTTAEVGLAQRLADTPGSRTCIYSAEGLTEDEVGGAYIALESDSSVYHEQTGGVSGQGVVDIVAHGRDPGDGTPYNQIRFWTRSGPNQAAERVEITSEGQLVVTNADNTVGFGICGAFTPSSRWDPRGEPGDIAWDENYFYVKTSQGWKRSSLSTW
jgi:hypothetical protein